MLFESGPLVAATRVAGSAGSGAIYCPAAVGGSLLVSSDFRNPLTRPIGGLGISGRREGMEREGEVVKSWRQD